MAPYIILFFFLPRSPAAFSRRHFHSTVGSLSTFLSIFSSDDPCHPETLSLPVTLSLSLNPVFSAPLSFSQNPVLYLSLLFAPLRMAEENPAIHGRVDPTPFIRASTSPATISTNNISFLSRRILPEPPVLVPETESIQLEERHTDWGYSKPVVFLDVVWNLSFVLVSAFVVASTLRERPSMPLRFWLGGYCLQCLLHVGFVFGEYQRRERARRLGLEYDFDRRSVVKRLESINTIVSFLWWIVGFCWIISGGQALMQDAPRLYWLTVVFLAFDVFFALFCVVLACVIGIALCCCLPCLIAIFYALAGQGGASDAEISILPRFRFRSADRQAKFDLEKQQAVVVTISEPSTGESLDELSLSPEDSECCICLSQYEEGTELHYLPCNHHFHSGCIVRWLRINATCPLCKYNIIKGNEQV